MLHLSTVQDVFELTGRGVVVIPGIPKRAQQKWTITAGQPVMLETPDGTTLHTAIVGIEMASPAHPDFIPVLLGPGLSKRMVPVGTKLWVTEDTFL